MALVKDLAREKAQRVLNDYWDGRLPVDPVRIALDLGMNVFEAHLDDSDSGMIVKEAGKPASIYLNVNEPAARQNFTCAHELGHWFERDAQHDDEYSFVDKRGDRPMDAHEWYAEHFAANLLMPAREFIKQYDLHDGSIRKLADTFLVSLAAARNRARNLGLSL